MVCLMGKLWSDTNVGVCWNLIGQEGNISRVAAGLPVRKSAIKIKKIKTK